MSWWSGASFSDLYDAAWHGIAEHLIVSPSATEDELLIAGTEAARKENVSTLRQHGRIRDGVNFGQYWAWHSHATGSPEDGVVEREALWQIWEVLSPSEREALYVLAATDNDRDMTAAALGITRKALEGRLHRARHAFLTHWHEGESPSRMWRRSMPEGFKANAKRENGRFVA